MHFQSFNGSGEGPELFDGRFGQLSQFVGVPVGSGLEDLKFGGQ